MRQFTEVEKRKLRTKIEDEEARQHHTAEEIAQRIYGESRWKLPAWIYAVLKWKRASRTLHCVEIALKFGFLGFILWMLASDVVVLLDKHASVSEQFAELIMWSTLLFSYIALFLAGTGRLRRVMKAAAWMWMIVPVAYVTYLDWGAGLIIAPVLLLLFDWIAPQITKKGSLSRVMKSVVWIQTVYVVIIWAYLLGMFVD